MAKEIWKTVPGYSQFDASSHGRVRAEGKIISPTLKRTPKTGKPQSAIAPYSIGGRKVRTVFIHKLVLLAFRGPAAQGQVCCHNDGNCLNNRLENLRWDTQRSNIQDSIRHGTFSYAPGFPGSQRGEANWQAKLTEDDIRSIRKRVAEGEKHKATAAAFNLHPAYVSLIVHRKRWAHVG